MAQPRLRIREQLVDKTIKEYDLPLNGVVEILTGEDNTFLFSPIQDQTPTGNCMARLTVKEWAVKLEAVLADVDVYPDRAPFLRHSLAHWPHFILNRCDEPGKASNHILLRDRDVIKFGTRLSKLVFEVLFDDVQVDSSVPVQAIGHLPGLEDALSGDADSEYGKLADSSSLKDGHAFSRTSTPIPPLIRTETRTEKIEETPQAQRKRFVIPTSSSVGSLEISQRRTESFVADSMQPTTVAAISQNGRLSFNDKNTVKSVEYQEREEFTSHVLNNTSELRPQLSSVSSENGVADAQVPTSSIRRSHKVEKPPPERDAEQEAGEEETESEDEPVEAESVADRPSILISQRTPAKRGSPSEASEPPTTQPRKRARTEESLDSAISSIKVGQSGRSRVSQHASSSKRRSLSKASEASAARAGARARRSSGSVDDEDDKAYAEYTGPPPKVAFSNSAINTTSSFLKVLRSARGSVVDAGLKGNWDFLCTRPGHLKSTAKFLLSIALGKPIVTDEWLIESAQRGFLLDPEEFLLQDTEEEKQWGFNFLQTLDINRSKLLEGKTVWITPALKKEYGSGYREIEDVAHKVGAKKVVSKPARDLKSADNCIVLALEQRDLDAITLHEKSIDCYQKELLSVSIFRGSLDLDSHEFRIEPSDGQSNKSGRKKRNS